MRIFYEALGQIEEMDGISLFAYANEVKLISLYFWIFMSYFGSHENSFELVWIEYFVSLIIQHFSKHHCRSFISALNSFHRYFKVEKMTKIAVCWIAIVWLLVQRFIGMIFFLYRYLSFSRNTIEIKVPFRGFFSTTGFQSY